MSAATTSMTPIEAEAVLLVRSGHTAEQAAAETHLDVERIAALVARADSNRASRPVPAAVAHSISTPIARPAPKPIAAAPKPTPATFQPRMTMPITPEPPRVALKRVEPVDLDTIDDLLDWAEEADLKRAITLAGRIRAAAAELREMRRRHEHVADARDKVAALERQLREARDELRVATTGNSASAPAGAPSSARKGADVAERARIRAWARENGYQVGDKGIIAAAIVSAYHDANS